MSDAYDPDEDLTDEEIAAAWERGTPADLAEARRRGREPCRSAWDGRMIDFMAPTVDAPVRSSRGHDPDVLRRGAKPMRDCRERRSWAPVPYRCRNRGWIVGLCLTHFLDRCRWERRVGEMYLSLDFSMLNLPRLHWSEERPLTWVSLDYGTCGSDPVWSVAWNKKLTEDTEEVA